MPRPGLFVHLFYEAIGLFDFVKENRIVNDCTCHKRNGYRDNHVLVSGRSEVGKLLTDADGKAHDTVKGA